MARDPRIEALLLEWSHWLGTGNDGTGYSKMSVLHKDWMPPTPGGAPMPKMFKGSEVRSVHDAVGHLSRRLQEVVLLHYCSEFDLEEQAQLLGCAVSTVHARLSRAHLELRKKGV